MNNASNPLGTDYLLNSLSGGVIIIYFACVLCVLCVSLQAQEVGEAYLYLYFSFILFFILFFSSSSSSLYRVIVKTSFGFLPFFLYASAYFSLLLLPFPFQLPLFFV